MEAVVLDLEEVQEGAHALGASDGVAEDHSGLTLLLTQVVVGVQVFLLLIAFHCEFLERVRHAFFLREVYDLRVLRPEPQCLAQILQGCLGVRLGDALLLQALGFLGSDSALGVNGERGRAYNVLDAAHLLVVFGEVLLLFLVHLLLSRFLLVRLLGFGRLVFAAALVKHQVFGVDFFKHATLIIEVLDLVQVYLDALLGLQVLDYKVGVLALDIVQDACAVGQLLELLGVGFNDSVLVFSKLELLELHSLLVDVVNEQLHFLEVPVFNHAVSFIKH